MICALLFSLIVLGLNINCILLIKSFFLFKNMISKISFPFKFKAKLHKPSKPKACANYLFYSIMISICVCLMCRTPNLKTLVLPISSEILKNGLETAMRSWGCLESITITTIVYDFKYFYAIGKHCKNITSLKFACFFGQEEA